MSFRVFLTFPLGYRTDPLLTVSCELSVHVSDPQLFCVMISSEDLSSQHFGETFYPTSPPYPVWSL